MLPPSLAIGWTLWRQHRWGLLALLGYLVVATTVAAVLPMTQLTPHGVNVVFAALISPQYLLVVYLVAVLCKGFDADLNSPGSCFPAGMLTLPVRTGALAGWHLAYGAAAVGLLWWVTAWFILRPWLEPWGLTVPLWWPAVLAAALVAWVQAMLWLPFGLPGLRILLATALLSGMLMLTGHLVTSGASESFLVALFLGFAAVAWLGAYAGVRSARRGQVPSWEGLLRPLRRLVDWLPRRRRPFAAAAGAQVWFEWRRAGNSLPAMTALVVPVALLPLLLGLNDVIPTAQTLLSVLAIPVILAGLAATTVSGRNPWVKDYYGVAPFTATLPMSTASMVAARLKVAALSTLAAWALVVVDTSLAVWLTGKLDEAAGWWRQAANQYGPVKTVAGLVAGAVLLVVWTWKRHVDGLFLNLTGRVWVIGTSLVVNMIGFCALCILASWIIEHPEKREPLLAWLPWLLGLPVLARLLATALALRLVLRWRLLERRTVAYWMTGWLALALVLVGLLVWVVPAGLVSGPYLALGVVWCLPMTHLAAAPLALAWNRHR